MTRDHLSRRGFAVLLTCALVGAGGCGTGDSGDGAAARAVAKQFVTIGAHPTAKFCDVLSQRLLEQRTRQKGAAAMATCRARIEKAGARNRGAVPPGLEFGEAKVDGATADVKASAPGLPTAALHLVKENGSWKVDSASG